MIERTLPDNEHRELAELLPWHVNRTLDADEQQRLDAHLEHCDRCRAEHARWHETLEASAGPETVPEHSEARLSRIMERIETHEATTARRTGADIGFLAQLQRLAKNALMVSPQALGATAVVLAAAGLVVFTVTSPTKDEYETRSAADQGSSMQLNVTIDGGWSDKQIDALIAEAGDGLQWQTDEAGHIRVTLPADMPASDVLGIVSALKARQGVVQVEMDLP